MNENFNWRMRAAAIGWLRYEQRCFLVCWERSPWSANNYRPDLLGVNRERKVIEVEFKQTLADFKANARKHGLRWRQQVGLENPVRFYFAVPPRLVEKIKPLLPEGCGLLTLEELDGRFGPRIEVVTGARHDRTAERLTKLQIARMVMHQTGTLHRACVALAKRD